MADWGKQVTLLLWVHYLGDKGAYLRVSSADLDLPVRGATQPIYHLRKPYGSKATSFLPRWNTSDSVTSK